jgi:hypothetical protein
LQARKSKASAPCSRLSRKRLVPCSAKFATDIEIQVLDLRIQMLVEHALHSQLVIGQDIPIGIR